MFKHGDPVIVREPGVPPYRAVVVRCEGMGDFSQTLIFDPSGGVERFVLTGDLREAPKSALVA